jgi:hypothetical protein
MYDRYDNVNANVPPELVENREFWNYKESFDGTTGVGCGPLSAMPAACTPGVGYWATDQDCSSVSSNNIGANPSVPISGTLYRCIAPNTWAVFYTPYTYPHPLRGEAPSTPTEPAPPPTEPTEDPPTEPRGKKEKEKKPGFWKKMWDAVMN